MEITRKTETITETKRCFVVSQTQSSERIFCQRCSELMISAEQCAAVFGVSRRTIYRRIELEPNVHFTETANGTVLICPGSLTAISEPNLNVMLKSE